MLLYRSLRICLVITLTNQINGYVLFAANLEDFRSIAKKFIPEKLADQLAEMASESSAKYRQKAVEKDEQYEEPNESEGDTEVTKPYDVPKTTAKKRYVIKNPIPEVNIDDLVEKVRQKLLHGTKRQPKGAINSQKQRINNKNIENTVKSPPKQHNVDYDPNSYEAENTDSPDPMENYEEITTKRHPQIIKSKPNVKEKRGKQHTPKEYEESVTQSDTELKNQPSESGKLFEEFALGNNDNYEDYVTPAKDKIFESDETTTKAHKALRHEKIYKQNNKTPHYDERPPQDYENDRARTESLLYDYKDVENRTTERAVRNTKNPKKIKGTMIPTREFYKMTTPDYYHKLPVVAEKYNFDEPIPEKDREPENLRPIGNPPARINKKVKV